MIKNILATSLVCAALLLSGCGESDAESQLQVQQMLDNGDYAGVIARLEGTATTQSEFIALGSAYMGAAGLSLSDLITIIADSNNNNTDAFASFANSIDEKTANNPHALEYLGKSTDAYKKVVGDACSDNNATLTDSQRDICLYTGLSESMRATVTLGYLGDVASLATSGSSDDELAASACAMQYAFNGSVSANCTKGSDENITFVESNATYTTFFMTVNGKSFDYLKTTQTPGSTVIANGYCPLNSFADRNTTMTYDTKTLGYYICPVDEAGDQNLTTEALLVDILNGGFDSVIAGVGGTGSDLASDIEEFKSEINQDANATISIDDIINYINNQNQ